MNREKGTFIKKSMEFLTFKTPITILLVLFFLGFLLYYFCMKSVLTISEPYIGMVNLVGDNMELDVSHIPKNELENNVLVYSMNDEIIGTAELHGRVYDISLEKGQTIQVGEVKIYLKSQNKKLGDCLVEYFGNRKDDKD